MIVRGVAAYLPHLPPGSVIKVEVRAVAERDPGKRVNRSVVCRAVDRQPRKVCLDGLIGISEYGPGMWRPRPSLRDRTQTVSVVVEMNRAG